MTPELPSYIMTPCEHTDEVMLTTISRRGRALAKLLALRVARTQPGPWRYYLTPKRAKHWKVLMERGCKVVRRNGRAELVCKPRPMSIKKALE